MSQPDQPEAKPRWTAVSVALFVIGLLILVPSGLCTALVGILTLVEGDPSGIVLALMFGGVPMAVGVALVWAGFKARPRE